MAHVFFASYARLDENQYSPLRDTVRELETRVRQQLGAHVVDVAFLDATELTTGAKWVEVLGAALSRSWVIVCFCSNTYFNSVFCANEFEVFRRRLAAAGNALDGVPVVVPVVWEKCDIPRAVSKYQLADAGFPADYLKLGLCRMHRVKSTRIEVQTAIDALADVIVQVATGATRLPPLAGALNFDEFVAAFDNPGTRSIRVAALHDDGFRLGIGGIRTLRHAVEGVAARLDTPWRAVKAGDDVARLLAQFEAAREPVVLVTDEASGAKAPWNLRLAATDAAGRTNFAVLLGVSGLDAGAAELALRRTVPVSLAAGAPHDWFSLDDAAEFARKFTQSVTKLNMELIRAGEPAKVTDARLEDAARKDGIPIDVHPTVAGPGSAGS